MTPILCIHCLNIILFFNNRVNRRGGGVALYVPTHLPYIALNELNMMKNTLESVFIEIILPNRKKLSRRHNSSLFSRSDGKSKNL